MPTGINPERQKGIPLSKAALALTPLTIGVLSACSNNPAMAKPPEGVTPIATDTATAIIPMTPAHAPSIIPASPTITVEVSPLPPSKATETITATVPVITPTVGTPLPLSGTPFAVPSATETNNPTVTVTKTVVPTATKEATATPTRSPEEIRKEAKTIADQLTSGPNAVVPADLDAGRRQIIHDAIEQAGIYAPYGVNAKKVNNFITNYTRDNLGEEVDLRTDFNNKFQDRGFTFDDLMSNIEIETPSDLFTSTSYIGPPLDGKEDAIRSDGTGIYIPKRFFNGDMHYLSFAIVKEAMSNMIHDWVEQTTADRVNQHKKAPTLQQKAVIEDRIPVAVGALTIYNLIQKFGHSPELDGYLKTAVIYSTELFR